MRRFLAPQLGLMKNKGSLTIPMDFNYKVSNGFELAAAGCPGAGGARQCAEVAFPTFQQLADKLDGEEDAH